LKPDIIIGTKVLLAAQEPSRIGEAIAASLEASLRRLGRDEVDIFQLHNPIGANVGESALTPEVVLGEVVPAFERLRQDGKIRFYGITAIGDPGALHRVIAARALDTAQTVYNMLNPSAGGALAAGYPALDYGNLLDRLAHAEMGAIGIRVLAGGALSGSELRHPIGLAEVAPIGSGADYRADVRRARRLAPLVAEGHAASLVEAALRFAISPTSMTTVLIGTSTLDELETAADAVDKGPLPAAALARLATLQAGFAGEAP
jgi:L-galactose dehydrogenase/L-glyceraldehyde 3-phosphate reductase